MSDDRVEGFANYETFSVAVVIDNDQGSHDHIRNLVWELEASGHNRFEILDAIQNYYEAQMPELDGFWSSLLSAGWEAIDWLELVDHWRDPEWRAAQVVT